MKFNKVFLLIFALVASIQFVQACDLTGNQTCARQSPVWGAGAQVNDSGAAFPSDQRLADGLPNIKEAREGAVALAREAAEAQRVSNVLAQQASVPEATVDAGKVLRTLR